MPISVYPTGTTTYYPEKCWNGYTVFQATMFSGNEVGAVLIDMNGNVVNQWKGLDGIPNKMLPGGQILGSIGVRNNKYGMQDSIKVVQADWDGNIVWKFDRHERVKDPRQKPAWMARQHHDYQREGNPVGYYVPGMEPRTDGGNTLILCHRNVTNPAISGKPLLDDAIIEVTWDGKTVWEWMCSEHFDELGFSEDAKNAIYRNPNVARQVAGKPGDWMHLNAMSRLGPNKWFDEGDERFHPDNIIWSARNANIIAIVSKETGKIVWRLGPDYAATEELKKMGWIIGQHHAHMIPRGLPGEGNILVFDNGGSAGYGAANPGSPTGMNNAVRTYSRVIEFDPVTLETIWTSRPPEAGPGQAAGFRIFSHHISSAQRLPNGNTLVTEGAVGRVIEVTRDYETVWEYVSPFFNRRRNVNEIYRAYRLPYEWAPQAGKPEENPIKRPDISKLRVPGSPLKQPKKVTKIKA